MNGAPRASPATPGKPDQRASESPVCPGHHHPARKPADQHFCLYGRNGECPGRAEGRWLVSWGFGVRGLDNAWWGGFSWWGDQLVEWRKLAVQGVSGAPETVYAVGETGCDLWLWCFGGLTPGCGCRGEAGLSWAFSGVGCPVNWGVEEGDTTLRVGLSDLAVSVRSSNPRREERRWSHQGLSARSKKEWR